MPYLHKMTIEQVVESVVKQNVNGAKRLNELCEEHHIPAGSAGHIALAVATGLTMDRKAIADFRKDIHDGKEPGFTTSNTKRG